MALVSSLSPVGADFVVYSALYSYFLVTRLVEVADLIALVSFVCFLVAGFFLAILE